MVPVPKERCTSNLTDYTPVARTLKSLRFDLTHIKTTCEWFTGSTTVCVTGPNRWSRSHHLPALHGLLTPGEFRTECTVKLMLFDFPSTFNTIQLLMLAGGPQHAFTVQSGKYNKCFFCFVSLHKAPELPVKLQDYKRLIFSATHKWGKSQLAHHYAPDCRSDTQTPRSS